MPLLKSIPVGISRICTVHLLSQTFWPPELYYAAGSQPNVGFGTLVNKFCNNLLVLDCILAKDLSVYVHALVTSSSVLKMKNVVFKFTKS